MKLFSWNVNGIRACVKKGNFFEWFDATHPDVLCVQETKAKIEQLEEDTIHPLGYHSSFHSAEKPGYSGVATFSKKEPEDVQIGMGIEKFDQEGRVLTSFFKDFVLINAYFPNSQRGQDRLEYKVEFCDAMLKYCNSYVKDGKNVVLCGDYNIAHQPIDLKNPKANEKTAGYLPEERAWMGKFLEAGYADCFRRRVQEPDHYTWWSFRPGVRARNVGWRIDYHCVNDDFDDRVEDVFHQPNVMGSDHCPVGLVLG